MQGRSFQKTLCRPKIRRESSSKALLVMGEVPILKNFFSDQNVNVQETEVLVTMTPQLVRLAESVPTTVSNRLPDVEPGLSQAPKP